MPQVSATPISIITLEFRSLVSNTAMSEAMMSRAIWVEQVAAESRLEHSEVKGDITFDPWQRRCESALKLPFDRRTQSS